MFKETISLTEVYEAFSRDHLLPISDLVGEITVTPDTTEENMIKLNEKMLATQEAAAQILKDSRKKIETRYGEHHERAEAALQ